MKRRILCITPLICLSALFGGEAVKVTDLRCEYRIDPLGIDATKPHLSWRIESTAAGQKQTAYQVIVSGSTDGDLWDSGKINSAQSQHVAYAGKPLTSKMAYRWKARVWDRDGKAGDWSKPAMWTMGLLAPGDWKGKWITAPPPAALKPGSVSIIKATYGPANGKDAVDVKGKLDELIKKNRPIIVHPKTFGGGKKAKGYVLTIEYVLNGKKRTARGKYKQKINLSGKPDKGKPAPHLRKEFDLAAAPTSAYVTVNSPAFFELYVNGTKVGADVLTPAVSRLDKRTFYVTYDVRAYLTPGRNCLGLWIGHYVGPWSNPTIVRAQLDAVVNGKNVVIGTDTTWQTRGSGRYTRKQGNFGGELVDARELIPDWSKPGLDNAGWQTASPCKPVGGRAVSQPCPLNRIGKEIPARSVTEIGPGLYEIDFGTALTGWCRLKLPRLTAETTVTLTFADTKSKKKKSRLGQIGSMWYQTFGQVSKFISAGEAGEVFQHKFNYAAFRYAIVQGLPTAPATTDATAMLVETGMERTGSFECSNDLLNRIFQLNEWTQRCLNLGGYSVDCPHRERKGYGGDGQTPVEGVMTSFRADGFYRKWLTDWQHVQKSDGSLPNTAPQGFGGGGPAWGGFVAAVTWRHYLYYGDKRVIKENYDTVRKYVEYMENVSRKNGDILTGKVGRFSFIGDWVAPGRGMDSKDQPSHEARGIFNNCYRIYHLQLFMKMANVLGKKDVVAKYQSVIDRIRPIIHETYYKSGKYVYDQQAYYILPLMTGVTPESLRSEILGKLEHNIKVTRKGHLDTGLLGTYFLLDYLRTIGRSDLLFTIFTQTTYPGWGYMLDQGATTVWEQWNGYFSHIHSCFPSANNWLYQGLAGIQADPDAPGFRNVIIRPDIVGDVTWVKAHHDSPYGRIVSNWKLENGTLTMEVEIPPNSTATVYVPGTSVTVNGAAPKNARTEGGRTILHIESGQYRITTKHGVLE